MARERCAAVPCYLASSSGHNVSVAAASTASNNNSRTLGRLVSLADSILTDDYNRSRWRYDRRSEKAKSKKMKILVMGAGAVGAYFGARMRAAGEGCGVCARCETLRASRGHGVY